MASSRGETVDDEFLMALYQGGELLAAGKVIEAKDHLERAFKLQPKNEKGQNLLGLTYFKLGLFDRAAEIYEMLVRENPADPTLRINLGLVYLKSNALQRAIREFEVATDLQPEHAKSHNYLGLALAQSGEYGRAREHFLLAGSDAMAQKMERALAGEQVVEPIQGRSGRESTPTPPPLTPSPLTLTPAPVELREVPKNGAQHVEEPAGDATTPSSPAAPPEGEVQIDLMSDDQVPPEAEAEAEAVPAVGEVHWGDQFGLDGEAPTPRPTAVAEAPPLPEAQPVAIVEESVPSPPTAAKPPEIVEAVELAEPEEKAEPTLVGKPRFEMAPPPSVPAPPPDPEPEPAPARPPPREGGPPTLAQLAPKLLLHPKENTPFAIDGEMVLLHVHEELLTRLGGLMGFTGRLEFQPEVKRFRGRPTDKPFGEAESRMTRVRGNGLIAVDAGKHLFVPLDLGEDSAYFREDLVFAFEEAVMFENGRVPSEVPPDLDLVHLRGAGKALLALPGPLRSLDVKMDRPVTLPLTQLVGWHGNLTPRMVSVGWDAKGKPARAGVELTGEGFALFSLPVS